jgi:Methyltransferase domain
MLPSGLGWSGSRYSKSTHDHAWYHNSWLPAYELHQQSELQFTLLKTFLHLCRVCIGLDGPESQVTAAELEMLLRFSRCARVAVELGCYEGKTAAAIALNDVSITYSVDPWHRGRLGIPYGELIAKVHRRRVGATNLVFLRGYSFEAARQFDETIDFLFIDANHEYEAVCQDWKDWFPKVRRRGYVALHDSKIAINSPSNVGSMQFYDNDLCAMRDIAEVGAVDSLVVFRVAE